MTEREFQTAYLMGAYHEQQLSGNALTDVSFEHIEPTKLMLQQAKKQYKNYLLRKLKPWDIRRAKNAPVDYFTP